MASGDYIVSSRFVAGSADELRKRGRKMSFSFFERVIYPATPGRSGCHWGGEGLWLRPAVGLWYI